MRYGKENDMRKNENSNASIRPIMMTAMVLVLATFGGIHVYRGKNLPAVDSDTVIESASPVEIIYETALVENTEDDYVYSERIKFLAANKVVSRGNYVREQLAEEIENGASEVNQTEEETNILLTNVLNGIKELSEKQADMTKSQTEDKTLETPETIPEVEMTGVPTEYVKTIDVKATAYCLCTKCCGKSPSSPGYGMTASGLRIIPNTGMKVVAADPSIIPLGTHVYVEGLNGAPDYGYAVVADTGSAIKNLKIDLYMETHEMALDWGRRSVRVYVLAD